MPTPEPPTSTPPQTKPQPSSGPLTHRSAAPAWRRGPGVAEGTWRYTTQTSIADGYDDFVARTPLCDLDARLVGDEFPVVAPNAHDVGAIGTHWIPRPRILDLGCGTGRTSELLADRGYDVLAVDLSQSMLRRLVRDRGTRDRGTRDRPITPLRGNLVQMDFLADDVADGAVCLFSTLGMIQGRRHRREMLAHVARIVRPDGVFVLHVHHRYASFFQSGGRWALVRDRCRSWWDRDFEFGDAVYAYRGLPDMFLHRFSGREVIADLRATGWRIQTMHRLTLDGSGLLASSDRFGVDRLGGDRLGGDRLGGDRLGGRWNVAGGFVIVAVRESAVGP